MRSLHPMVRRIPAIFYALGAIFLVWSLGNSFIELSILNNPYDPGGLEGVQNLAKSKALYQATIEAAYLVGNGAIIQVLIAINDKLGGSAQ